MVPDELLRLIVPKPFVYGSTDHMRAGWIFPDRSIVPCAITAHRDVLPEQYRARYTELMEQYEEAWNEDLEAMDPDEHVPWHDYDPEWSSNSTLLRELSELGYMRIGAYQDHNGRIGVEFGGSKRHLKAYHDLLAYIVAAVGAEEVYFTDHEAYGYSRKRQRQFS